MQLRKGEIEALVEEVKVTTRKLQVGERISPECQDRYVQPGRQPAQRREPSCIRRYTRDCYKVMKRSKKTMGAGRVGFKKVEFESAILCSMVENITQKRYSICRVISGI